MVALGTVAFGNVLLLNAVNGNAGSKVAVGKIDSGIVSGVVILAADCAAASSGSSRRSSSRRRRRKRRGKGVGEEGLGRGRCFRLCFVFHARPEEVWWGWRREGSEGMGREKEQGGRKRGGRR